MRRTFRMELCLLLENGPGQTAEDLRQALAVLYPGSGAGSEPGKRTGEGQVSNVATHLQALRAIGIVRVCGEELSGDDKPLLVQHWELTPSGRERLHKMLA